MVMTHMSTIFLYCLIFINTCCSEAKQNAKDHWLGWKHYITRVGPVGLLVSADIAMSNAGFLFLSVPIVEMLKSSVPVFILIFSFMAGLERPTWRTAVVILVISSGIALSSYPNKSQTDVAVGGFILVISAAASAGLRWVLTEQLMKGRHKLSPLVTLMYTAPLSVVSLIPPFLVLELHKLSISPLFVTKASTLRTLGLLLGSTPLALFLNFSEYLLVSNTSVLTMTVCGVAKTLLVIAISVLVFGEKNMSLLNKLGFVMCFSGVGIYNYLRYRNLREEEGGRGGEGGTVELANVRYQALSSTADAEGSDAETSQDLLVRVESRASPPQGQGQGTTLRHNAVSPIMREPVKLSNHVPSLLKLGPSGKTLNVPNR
eukprot:CAMPEP_0184643624 /NCGR_PEP_ID=MMETSP0308-20130426/454_1 /TAXON_ID=38269 /ORGANISM="Gloeochaete witrockiana, Strain SAG 46.84" /LENGTH=373 /DNA_ID=CAMNT_0027071675 /DNA_START=395 /DNA_END=1516 /DNA_ORIENTATION=+